MADYFHAAIPDPVRILGLKLKPFSVGHQLLLERESCAFVAGHSPTFDDLILGLSICSRSFVDALRFLDSPRAKIWLRWWGFKTFLRVKFCGADLIRSTLVFAAYVRNGSTMPDLLIQERGLPRNLKAPMAALAAAQLCRDGHNYAEAMETPYGLALWHYCLAAAMDGRTEIVDEEWRKDAAALSISTPEEIERMVTAHRRATRRN